MSDTGNDGTTRNELQRKLLKLDGMRDELAEARARVAALEDAGSRAADTVHGVTLLLEALATCGDLGEDLDDAHAVLAHALESAMSELANA